MKRIFIYVFGCLCLTTGSLAFFTPAEDIGFCLVPYGGVWNASEIRGPICYSHSLPEGPVTTCNNEECGQCEAAYCRASAWPCSLGANPIN